MILEALALDAGEVGRGVIKLCHEA